MYKNKIITVVIPCHNEEDGLPATKKLLPDFIDHIVVVDNLSTDRTAEVALSLGAIVVREEKKGYGNAYQRGFASLPADTEIVVTCDGDGTYAMDELPQILDLVIADGYDFISAARFPLKDKSSMPFANKIGNLGLTFLFLIVTGRWINDSQSGMWIFRKEILRRMRLTSGGMPLSEEIKMEAMLNKEIKFCEYHINYYQRVGEVKLQKFKDGFENLIFLFKKRWQILIRK